LLGKATPFVGRDRELATLEAIFEECAGEPVARAVLVYVFDQALRLLHPVVPFVSEALWQRLPGRTSGEFLARAAWPTTRSAPVRGATNTVSFDFVVEVVSAIRQIRGDYNVPPGKMLHAFITGSDDDALAAIARMAAVIGTLARAEVTVGPKEPDGPAAHAVLSYSKNLSVELEGLVDLEKECARVRAELEQLEKQLGALEQRLANESFVSRAKPEIVDAERRKLGEWTVRREQLASKKRTLCGD